MAGSSRVCYVIKLGKKYLHKDNENFTTKLVDSYLYGKKADAEDMVENDKEHVVKVRVTVEEA